MAIKNSTITTDPTIIYSSVGSNAITTVIICNIGDPTSPILETSSLYLYAIPQADVINNGGIITPPANSTIVNGLRIPGGETVTFDQEKMVLNDGDVLVAKSNSPTNLVATISTLAV